MEDNTGAPDGPAQQDEAKQEEAIPGGFSNPTAPSHIPLDPAHIAQLIADSKPLRGRHRRVVELIALGKSVSFIAKETGYSENHVYLLTKNARIQTEVERYRDRLYSQTVQQRMQELGPEAVNVIEEMLTSDKEKLRDRTQTAQWVVEMSAGKAKQQGTTDSGETFLSILQSLERLRDGQQAALPKLAGGEGREVIEVEPKKADWMDEWVSKQEGNK